MKIRLNLKLFWELESKLWAFLHGSPSSLISIYFSSITMSTVVIPQDPPADSEHSCKDRRCPSPIHPGHFHCTMLQQNQQHREGPHPPLPQSLPAPTIRKTVPEHQSPLRQTAQQLFPPGCERPELRSPRPPLKPHAHPYLLKHGPPPPPLSKHPPNITASKKKLYETCLCNSSVLHTGEWACTNHL